MIHINKFVWLTALPVMVALPASAVPPASTVPSVATAPQAVKAPKKFLAPIGRIVYRMTSGGSKAISDTITMTWTDYGRKFRQDMQMHFDTSSVRGAKTDAAQKQPITWNIWTIYDGQSLYSCLPAAYSGGPGARKAIRDNLPQATMDQMPGLGSPGSIGAGSLGASGKVVGHATLLGRLVTLRAITANTPQINTNAKLWMWGNLPLRAEIVMHFKPTAMPVNAKDKNAPCSFQIPPMNVTLVATDLDVNVKPSPSLFRLPAGYVVQDRSEFVRQLQQKLQAQPTNAGSPAP